MVDISRHKVSKGLTTPRGPYNTEKGTEDMLKLRKIGEKYGEYATLNYGKVRACSLIEINY